jgi:hypothetical protein
MSIARGLPTANADSSAVTSPTRTGRYGEAYTAPLTNKEMFFADEGSHFVAINPTAGTGILGHAAPTTFDETKANILIYNGNSAGGPRIYLQSIKLVETVVSVGDTRVQANFSTDVGNLFSSGGTALTKNNVNADSNNASGAIITAGAVVLSAATASRRLLGNHVLRGANIDVVWDTYEFIFGAVGGSSGNMVTQTTTAAWITQHLHPIVIGPGQMFKMVLWAASESTGPTFEYLVNYVER